MSTSYDANPPTDLKLDEINLADPDFWLRDDYHAALAKLREERPISWHEHPDCGKGFWSFVDHEDIIEVTRSQHAFSNKYGTRVHHDYGKGLLRAGSDTMIEMDPPEHTASRRHVNRGFTPRQIRKMEEYVREQARRIVSRFSAGEEIDFVESIATPLPMEIICDMMGVEPADRPYLLDLSNRTLGDQDPNYGVSPEEGTKAILKMREYGVDLATDRLAAPKDDLISEIARIEENGKQLPKEQIGGYFALLIAAGNETTRTAISHGMHAFTKFPDQKRRFMEEPVVLEVSAAEEVIRWATPFRHMSRVLEDDVEYKGIRMRKGDKIAMWYSASNRDPKVFYRPFEFDITRDPNAHQSFGGGGPHFCLGANLARREVWVLFQELFARFPDAVAIEEPVRIRSVQVNGVSRLKVRL